MSGAQAENSFIIVKKICLRLKFCKAKLVHGCVMFFSDNLFSQRLQFCATKLVRCLVIMQTENSFIIVKKNLPAPQVLQSKTCTWMCNVFSDNLFSQRLQFCATKLVRWLVIMQAENSFIIIKKNLPAPQVLQSKTCTLKCKILTDNLFFEESYYLSLRNFKYVRKI